MYSFFSLLSDAVGKAASCAAVSSRLAGKSNLKVPQNGKTSTSKRKKNAHAPRSPRDVKDPLYALAPPDRDLLLVELQRLS